MNARNLLLFALVLWAACILASFAITWGTEPAGSGFTRGMNRITTFFGWQFTAGLLGIFIWVIGRRFDKGTGMRRLSWLPVGLFGAEVAALVGLVIYLNLTKPDPVPYAPPGTPTAEPSE
ncbi:MAG: hypothetical protein GY945_01335 [Rhodobacteraceae bacterium]|nr:hypothetical protein [Paracoccaceae bacterium]